MICHAGDEKFESEWIGRSVQKLAHAGVPWREIAVLVRTNHLTFAMEAGVRSRKIPYVVRPARDFWELPEVKAVLEVARHLESGLSDLSLTLGYLVGPVSQALEESRASSFASPTSLRRGGDRETSPCVCFAGAERSSGRAAPCR